MKKFLLSSKRNKIKLSKPTVLWLLFFIELVLLLIIGFEILLGVNFAKTILARTATLLPFTLVMLHCIWTLSLRRSLSFVALAASVAFIAEVLANNPNTFGVHFVYHSGLFIFLGVSLGALVYWIIFIYLGYSLVNSFLLWLKKAKPSISDKNFYLLPILVLADGLVVVGIDLFMDPLYVKAGLWTWMVRGDYFGVPLGNFVGWFVVVILTTSIFRLYEYFKPLRTTSLNKSVFLIPPLSYATLAIYFGVYAIMFEMYTLALIGSILMLPVSFANLFLYKISR